MKQKAGNIIASLIVLVALGLGVAGFVMSLNCCQKDDDQKSNYHGKKENCNCNCKH